MPSPTTWLVIAAALVATVPAWIVRHPPVQDVPFHLATIRVIHDYSSPEFGFESIYEINLSRTNYLLYALLGSLFANVLGVYRANVLMMSLCLGGLPLAMRAFLRAVNKDERLALFTVPLAVNVMFIYGLLPYLLGLPLMFFAMAAMITHFRAPSLARGLAVALWSTALFFSHIFPFGIFAVGALAYFPYRQFAKWRGALLAMGPAVSLICWWVIGSAVGKSATSSLEVAFDSLPFEQSLREFPLWSTNIFRDSSDEFCFRLVKLLALLASVLAFASPRMGKSDTRRFLVVLLVCVICFFFLGERAADFWLLSQRFPVPILLSIIPFLSMPRGSLGRLLTAALACVGIESIANVSHHFIEFERTEVGGLDQAISQIPNNKRVIGLIYDKDSKIVHNAPFLHAVSLVQVEHGGLVHFSFAHFPHWPFRYKEGKVPPPGKIKKDWEWSPEDVTLREVYPFYDFVLTRGEGFTPAEGTYRIKWKDECWAVWEKE
jgi:hypothetical protein